MAEYISRDLALSHPFANGHYDHENANGEFISGHESYREWLEDLPYVDMNKWTDVLPVGANRWIPVSDRLPRTYINVLVTADNGEVYIASKNPDDTFYFYEKLDDDDTQVIAWMPLPEPYREEGAI